MKSFNQEKFWCHLSFESKKKHTNAKIRKSLPLKVGNFKELVKVVAQISNKNAAYSLYFRGQGNDYNDNKEKSSSFYPSIYRDKNISLNEKYKILDDCSRQLVKELQSSKIKDISKIKKQPELQWAILQHYEVCGTPLIDITHSLRVAASFALKGTKKEAFIFIFALPFPYETISYYVEKELLNIRLISACPAEALRPHFQEGYYAGSFPLRSEKIKDNLDFSRCLISKIKIGGECFWDENFHAIPNDALYPENDVIKEICDKIKNR